MMADHISDSSRPATAPATRTLAMPGDTNPAGDIFGGWVLSQMDIAGGIVAAKRARGRCATVALEALTFHKPVRVGDIVSTYARVSKVGRTSLTVAVVTEVERRQSDETIKVTEGTFTYVALDEDGRPRPVDRE